MSTADDKFKEAFDRLREIEVDLAAHLATCAEATKAAEQAQKETKAAIKEVGEEVKGLRQDRDKVHGGVLAFRVVGAILVVASLVLNIYWALNR